MDNKSKKKAKSHEIGGVVVEFERRNIYCGHGPTRPILKKGWVILHDGKVIAGDESKWVSMMSDARVPVFPTFLDAMDHCNNYQYLIIAAIAKPEGRVEEKSEAADDCRVNQPRQARRIPKR